MHQIDIHDDHLAMAGDTYDFFLTGSFSGLPYIALQSISEAGKIYWAKVFSLKLSHYICGVQFSTDGALLISHSCNNDSFIAVIEVSSGIVKSARTYSYGGHWNYHNLVKSMLISKGLSPKAYVLSNY